MMQHTNISDSLKLGDHEAWKEWKILTQQCILNPIY